MNEYKWGERPYKTLRVTGVDIIENPDTSPLLVGHTIEWCNELEQAFNQAVIMGEQNKLDRDKYYQMLVDAEIIVPEKTAEQKMFELVQALTQTVSVLNQKIEKLEGEKDGDGYDNDNGNGNIEKDKPKSSANGKRQSATSETSETSSK